MNYRFPVLSALILFAFSLAFYRPLDAETPAGVAKFDPVLVEQFTGTFVVSFHQSGTENIALVDPAFENHGALLWLVGVVSERRGFVQSTPFTGGNTYIQASSIKAMQKLPN